MEPFSDRSANNSRLLEKGKTSNQTTSLGGVHVNFRGCTLRYRQPVVIGVASPEARGLLEGPDAFHDSSGWGPWSARVLMDVWTTFCFQYFKICWETFNMPIFGGMFFLTWCVAIACIVASRQTQQENDCHQCSFYHFLLS